MKKTRLLNSEISYEIAKLGHGDEICICDAGLPIPSGVKRIDLALAKGMPGFLEVLDVVLDEVEVEEIVVATEMIEDNPTYYKKIEALFEKKGIKPKVSTATHENFKERTNSSKAVIRTGETTPYANLILKSGVTF